MVRMQPETKQRLSTVFSITKFMFHWGFIPTVIYLGFRKGNDPGMPELTPLSWAKISLGKLLYGTSLYLVLRKILHNFNLIHLSLCCCIDIIHPFVAVKRKNKIEIP